MIEISDLVQVVSYIIGSFAFGYCSSFLFYIFRRLIWAST